MWQFGQNLPWYSECCHGWQSEGINLLWPENALVVPQEEVERVSVEGDVLEVLPQRPNHGWMDGPKSVLNLKADTCDLWLRWTQDTEVKGLVRFVLEFTASAAPGWDPTLVIPMCLSRGLGWSCAGSFSLRQRAASLTLSLSCQVGTSTPLQVTLSASPFWNDALCWGRCCTGQYSAEVFRRSSDKRNFLFPVAGLELDHWHLYGGLASPQHPDQEHEPERNQFI